MYGGQYGWEKGNGGWRLVVGEWTGSKRKTGRENRKEQGSKEKKEAR